jgi:hypothetical protein
MAKSAALIEFLASLHGFVRVGETRVGALDLESGIEYRAHPEDPDAGQLLIVGDVSNRAILSYPLIEFALVRHARAMAIVEGGSAGSQYKHIRQHYEHKVGA